MTANDKKSHLTYLNKLVDKYNNTYYHSINKNLLKLIVLLWPKILKRIPKLVILKIMIESELLSIKIFLVKVTLKIAQEKYLLSILSWKLMLRNKIRDLKEEKITESFYVKELLRNKL